MSVSSVEFGQRIAQVRERRGLSLTEAARLVDGALAPNSINRIENATRAPRLESLVALARMYDVDIVVTRKGTVEVRGSGIRVANEMQEPPRV